MKIITTFLGVILLIIHATAFADTPDNVTSIEVKSKFLSAASPPILDISDYDSLPICPSVISNCPTPDSTTPTPLSCPNWCKMTRTTTGSPITSVKLPTCPPEYRTAASFNIQPVLVYDPNPTDMPFPISDMGTYNNYVTQGYSCVDILGFNILLCSWNGNTGDLRANNPDPRYTGGGDGTVSSVNVYTYNGVTGVGYYRNFTDYGICYIYTLPACRNRGGCGASADPLYSYNLYYKRCTKPAGYYPSPTLQSPVSIVCSRILSTWKNSP